MIHVKRVSRVLPYEMAGLIALIGAYWVVELPIVAGLLLGPGQDARWDQAESVLLTALALALVCPIVLKTRRLASRVEDLERLLRADPWNRRVTAREQSVLVGALGDGNPGIAWRLGLDDWVQSTLHPELAGRVVAARAHQAAGGALREDYEIEVEGGFRFLVEGTRLRVLPLCEGQPMRFVGAGRSGPAPLTLAYVCPDCHRRSEILL
jgi:hypothetical protein